MDEKSMRIGSQFGWRGRIGVIYPASGLNEQEFLHFTPPGISIHFNRVHIPLAENEIIEDGKRRVRHFDLERAAKELSEVKPCCILWACTSESFKQGIEGELEQIKEIEFASGTVATTASSSAAEALKCLGARKIALGTPYTEEVTKKLADYFEKKGFFVINTKSLECSSDFEICSLLPEDTYALAKAVDVPEADVIFISCAAIRLGKVVEEVEADLGKPVFTSAMAGVWNALRIIGIQSPFLGLGTLFSRRR